MDATSLRCRGCRGWIEVPALEAADRARLVALLPDQRLLLVAEIRRLTGWDLRRAKALMLHLTTSPRRCHFEPCGSEQAEMVGTCATCRRVNVDWHP
jgi:hypothetical protein